MPRCIKPLVFVAVFAFAMLVYGLFFYSQSNAALNWAQTNTDGFGDANNSIIVGLAKFGDYLYTTAGNTTVGFGLYRSINGTTWDQVGSDGFGDVNNDVGLLGLAYGDIYVLTENVAGAELWKSSDGTTYSQVCTNGIGNTNNTILLGFTVFNDYLYIGTYNTTDGAEVIKISSDDVCTQVNSDGFGNSNNNASWALLSANGFLYSSAYNTTTGAEMWRSGDGTTWNQVASAGFGDSNNTDIKTLFYHNGYVYAGTDNSTTGAEIWRSNNGTSWSQTNTDGFGDSKNVWPSDTTIIVNDVIYLGIRDGTDGAAMFSSPDGTTWTQEGTDGFGDSNNFALYAQTFDGRIYIGFSNDITGAEIWRSDLVAQLAFLTSTLPSGSVGSPYIYAMSLSNGTPPYLYSITGELPPGLTMTIGGVISGTPTASGTYTSAITATDTGFPMQTVSSSFTITIPVSVSDASVLPETGALTK